MRPINEIVKQKPWMGWLIFFATIVVVFLLGLLASSIIERRAEAEFVYTPKVQYDQFEPRNEVWGQNFPREYETYMQTSDTSFRSKYNGSAAIDELKEAPELVVLWAGYPFSKEYNQGRGHYYAVNDVRKILRTGAPMTPEEGPMPGTCWTCKSPDVPRMMHNIGAESFYKHKWASLGSEIVNPIGCADCHNAKTMNLQISRPALVEAFQRIGIDVNKATHQEMRSLVCAQCHVEYYFKGDGKYLTFPWDKGFSIEKIEEYYNSYQFSDWKHSLSQTNMIKAQHPDYELFRTGVHYDRGVACADCHMPYKSEGGVKFTDHHIQSPLNNVANTCLVCHREETQKLISNVYERQDKIYENRRQLEKLLAKAHIEAKFAWDKGANSNQMEEALKLIRAAQWRWDFAAASHGASFHSPVEVSRIIASGINKVEEARLSITRVLAKLGYTDEVPMPDISTKQKAQQYIGLDMKKLVAEKKVFIEEIIPKWLKEAAERESKYTVKE